MTTTFKLTRTIDPADLDHNSAAALLRDVCHGKAQPEPALVDALLDRLRQIPAAAPAQAPKQASHDQARNRLSAILPALNQLHADLDGGDGTDTVVAAIDAIEGAIHDLTRDDSPRPAAATHPKPERPAVRRPQWDSELMAAYGIASSLELLEECIESIKQTAFLASEKPDSPASSLIAALNALSDDALESVRNVKERAKELHNEKINQRPIDGYVLVRRGPGGRVLIEDCNDHGAEITIKTTAAGAAGWLDETNTDHFESGRHYTIRSAQLIIEPDDEGRTEYECRNALAEQEARGAADESDDSQHDHDSPDAAGEAVDSRSGARRKPTTDGV